MQNSYVVGALGVVALSIGFYSLRPANHDVRVDELDALRAEVVQLRADLTAAETERLHAFAEFEAWMHSSQHAASPGATVRAGVAKAANPQATPAEMRAQVAALDAMEQEEKKPIDVKEFLDTAFTEESVDPLWAPDAEDTIRGKLGTQLPPGSVIQSVECHKSICRIATVHDDANAYEQFLTDIFKDPSKQIWPGDASSQELVQNANGERVVVSYFAREGASLPSTSR